MNKSIMRILICSCFVLICFSCAKRKPQLPSNKVQNQEDSTLLKMIHVNQVLAEKADGELTLYVHENKLNFVRHDAGFWYKINQKTHGEKISKNQTIEIHYKLYLLDGTLCEDVKLTVTLGKKQTLKSIELMLLDMQQGEQAVLLSPWYLAYGQAGNGSSVKSYEQVKIELSVN